MRLALLALLVVVAAAAVAAGAPQEKDWTIDVDNDRPFLGDGVIVLVESVYPNEQANVELRREGRVMMNLWVETDDDRAGEVLLQTGLHWDPGEYELVIEWLNRPYDNATFVLVYDPLDFALKNIVALQEEVDRLHEEDDKLTYKNDLNKARFEYYIWRWWVARLFLDVFVIVVLFYLVPPAWRKYIGRLRVREGRRGPEQTPGGTIMYDAGKETMEDTPAPEGEWKRAWCPKCRTEFTKDELGKHEGHDYVPMPIQVRKQRRLRT